MKNGTGLNRWAAWLMAISFLAITVINSPHCFLVLPVLILFVSLALQVGFFYGSSYRTIVKISAVISLGAFLLGFMALIICTLIFG